MNQSIHLDIVTLIDDIIYADGLRNGTPFEMEIPLSEFEKYAEQQDFFEFTDDNGYKQKLDLTEDYYCDGFGKLFHVDLIQFIIAKRSGLCH